MPTDKIPENAPHWLPAWLTSGKRTWPLERRFGWLMVLWALVLGLCMFTLDRDLVAAPYSWVIAAIPLLVAIAPVRAYTVFMRNADEMIRRIQIEAVLISFSVTLAYGVARTTFSSVGLD